MHVVTCRPAGLVHEALARRGAALPFRPGAAACPGPLGDEDRCIFCMVDEVPGPVPEPPVEAQVPGVGDGRVALEQVGGGPEDGVVHFIRRDFKRQGGVIEREACCRLVLLCILPVLAGPVREEPDERIIRSRSAEAGPAGVGHLPL